MTVKVALRAQCDVANSREQHAIFIHLSYSSISYYIVKREINIIRPLGITAFNMPVLHPKVTFGTKLT
jgi:hypothetical protein